MTLFCQKHHITSPNQNKGNQFMEQKELWWQERADFVPAINDTPIGTLFIEHLDCLLKQFWYNIQVDELSNPQEAHTNILLYFLTLQK